MKTRAALTIGILVLSFFCVSFLRAEDPPKPNKDANGAGQDIDELKKAAPKVFVDGEHLDLNFIKTEIPFVNYVRDRKEADVHVLITQQNTGSGGQEYTLAFIGAGSYEDLKNELKFYSNRIDTRDDSRRGLTQMIKLGLAPYIARTPIATILNMNINGKVKPTSVTDKWNFWVFSINGRTRLNGEQSRSSRMINGNFSINRTTPESKLRLGISGYQDRSKLNYTEDEVEYVVDSKSENAQFDGLYVKSLGEHWSVGGFVNYGYSTYSNIDRGLSIHPAIEYNLFPYAESTRRQFRILYRVGYNYDKYIERTIYDRMDQTTWGQTLTATVEITEPWGNVELSLEGSTLFLDSDFNFKILPPYKYNRLRIQGNISVRLIKGLSLTVDGRYSALRDQLNLKAEDQDLTELLLRRSELASNYTYQINLGLSFSFGSVYSNVVNPRFGGGFGGSSGGFYF